MIKKLANLLLVFVIIVGIVFGCSKINRGNDNNSMYLAMGDFLLMSKPSYADYVFEELKNEGVKEYNDLVKRSSLDSSSLLRFLEVKATIIKENESAKISDLIKKSKYITIQVGLVDFLANIRFSVAEEKFYYNVEIIEREVAQIQGNIYNIVNEIKEINSKANIYVLGYYFPYPNIKQNEKAIGLELYGQLNASLRLGSYDAGANFIDISELSSEEYLPSKETTLLNDEGQKKLASIILSSINNN